MHLAWLAAPYLSMLVICTSPRLGRHVARNTAWTLPLGWVAVLALATAVLGLWSPPLALMALCAALSGLAVLTTGGRDDGRGPDGWDDEPPAPVVDWDAFDRARRAWERRPVPRR